MQDEGGRLMTSRAHPGQRPVTASRDQRAERVSSLVEPLRSRLLELALRGLPAMYRGPDGLHAHTLRGQIEFGEWRLHSEGASSRYSAIVALGASLRPVEEQRLLFAGRDSAQFVEERLRWVPLQEPGAIALSAWAANELRVPSAIWFTEHLLSSTASNVPTTVETAWSLTALVAANELSDYAGPAGDEAQRLMAAQSDCGLFPHHIDVSRPVRGSLSCFADQVYPIQALARYATFAGDQRALAAANKCAARICHLQGEGGQWWWHYDTRVGTVVERYPVYSVHQHAMAPMALFELARAGGEDHTAAIVKGMSWVSLAPEVETSLVMDDLDLVWRSVYRREPVKKVVRAVRSLLALSRTGITLPWLDRLCPPSQIDHECRPYELGWLLYAWTVPTQPRSADHEGGA